MTIREADAKQHENRHVTVTLADGTKIKGYVSGVGHQGLWLKVKGSEAEWWFSAIKSIRARMWAC
ncbi:hypothetical protein [Streptomyces sp. NPDC059271]|uniref:hypothetical protein n=1 Tax=Streptomyces sp. NPDC059271 TaxID=3346799 RepID=UPI0036ADA700